MNRQFRNLFTRPLVGATIIFSFLFLTAPCAWSQNTADDLYLAVLQAQFELGDSTESDAIRDQFGIRQLETESARGFTADPYVFQSSLAALSAVPELPDSLRDVQRALAVHVDALDSANGTSVPEFLGGLSGELEAVSRSDLSRERDKVVEALAELDALHEESLSYYGRHYFNKRLGLPALVARLVDFGFGLEISGLPDDPAGGGDQDFNRELNTLRGELGAARQRFAFASGDYPTTLMSRAERAIAGFEQQVTAYLIGQTTRALQVFRDNLIRRRGVFAQGSVADARSSRLFQAELGRLAGMLEDRKQSGGFRTATRRLYSHPNLRLTVQESLVNRISVRPVSNIDHVDEVVLGSRAQGWSSTTGQVSFDFLNHPYSAVIRLNFAGSVESQASTKEGPVTAYTSTTGALAANRDIAANIGNISVFPVNAWATLNTDFRGTNCIPLVERIAFRRFSEREAHAEAIASTRAQARVRDEFTTETDAALDDGLTQVDSFRSRRVELLAELNQFRRKFSEILAESEEGPIEGPVEMVDPFVLPRLFVTSTDSELNVGGVLEGDNRLAAPSPADRAAIPADVRLQLHESFVSNLIAPLVQDRLVQNWQFSRLAEGLSSGALVVPAPEDERRWAILFEDGRPVQIEFDNNELVVTIYGKEFRDENRRYTDPLYISLRYRIVDVDGQLKLVRTSRAKVDFTFPPAPGKTLDPDAIIFRQFLQDNFDKALGDDPSESAIDLPPHLIPVENIGDDELRQRLTDARLVECVAENGWLTLGWNYLPGHIMGPVQVTYTPAIWYGMPQLPPPPSD